MAEVGVVIVLMSRPVLIDALLEGRSLEVVGDQIDCTNTDEDASPESKSGFGKAARAVSEVL